MHGMSPPHADAAAFVPSMLPSAHEDAMAAPALGRQRRSRPSAAPLPSVSNVVLDLIAIGLSAATAGGAGQRFFEALQPYGARTIYARAFATPGGEAWAERVYSRVSPPGWDSLYEERAFSDANPLPREARRRVSPFAWSSIALLTPAERELAQAACDSGFPDGIAVPCHGPAGYAGVVSLGFADLDGISPAERAAIEVAALVLHGRMRALAGPAPPAPRLTSRERDCLLFIGEGKSDGRIADLLGLGVPTVATHIKSARMKLGAKTRAQAVAHFLLGCLG